MTNYFLYLIIPTLFNHEILSIHLRIEERINEKFVMHSREDPSYPHAYI